MEKFPQVIIINWCNATNDAAIYWMLDWFLMYFHFMGKFTFKHLK